MADHNQPLPPTGRGKLLASLRELKVPHKGAVGITPPTPPQDEEPPKPRGRAAMLKKFSEMRAKAPGASTSAGSAGETTKESEELSKSLQSLSISQAEPVYFRGESGEPIRVASNFIRLDIKKDMGIFEYEVRFAPEIDARNRRVGLVNQIFREKEVMAKVFDGERVLYLPTKITDTRVVYAQTLPSDPNTQYEVAVIFKKKKNYSDSKCLQLYNILFKRIMYILLYQRMGRNYYNPNNRYLIPQHKLEIFPGFATAVDELEDGLMLCLDSSHRVLRTQTCYELLLEIRGADPQRFKERAASAIIGSVILTRYNIATYVVDDIAWSMTPRDTFQTKDGGSISFIDYFKKEYNIDIKDVDQPLFINRKTVRKTGSAEKEERFVCLIPELSFLTGMSAEMKNDFRVMKDVAMYTRITPHQRMNALMKFLENVRDSEKAQEVLNGWGLSLRATTIDIHARVLPSETIWFGGDRCVPAGQNADWNRAVGDNRVTGPVHFLMWIVFYTARDEKIAYNFGDTMVRIGPSLGCEILRPKYVKLPNDRNEAYMAACKEHINDKVQIVTFICPSMRNDRYSIIKKICCDQIPVPSQVINAKTLSNPTKARSIIVKIALQMNCKMGGTLWTVKIPLKGWMVVGIDVYHSSPKETVCGLVCSINDSFTKYYSNVIFQPKEIGDSFKAPFAKALDVYGQIYGTYPGKVVIIRDGVGDGQMDYVKRHEIAQFEEVLAELGGSKLCFVVVQKRISTKVFSLTSKNEAENPPSGTIVDHSITRRYLADFFLVPQSVRHGTVNPTHYVVLHDTCGMKPDHVQRLCYKLCHLYYNWPGTIRVPAVCQYAHRLAAIAGQHIKSEPSPVLCDKLFYL